MLAKVLKFVRDRAKEPSTWAALTPILAAAGWAIDGATMAAIGAGISALLGVILPENA